MHKIIYIAISILLVFTPSCTSQAERKVEKIIREFLETTKDSNYSESLNLINTDSEYFDIYTYNQNFRELHKVFSRYNIPNTDSWVFKNSPYDDGAVLVLIDLFSEYDAELELRDVNLEFYIFPEESKVDDFLLKSTFQMNSNKNYKLKPSSIR